MLFLLPLTMKTTCFVIALSVMVVCVTSRRISRTQVNDVYEGKLIKETDFETVFTV